MRGSGDPSAGLCGHRVRLSGLVGRADLNDKCGWATRFIPDKQRYVVQVDTPWPAQLGQSAETATEGERVLLKPANLIDLGELADVQVDASNRIHALLDRVDYNLQGGVSGMPENTRPDHETEGVLPELRAALAEAEALTSLLPMVDAGNVGVQIVARVYNRRLVCPSSGDQVPSEMRLDAFRALKHARTALAEAFEVLERFEEAQPLYIDLVHQAIAAEKDLLECPGEVPKMRNNCGLCWKRRGMYAEAIGEYKAGVKYAEEVLKARATGEGRPWDLFGDIGLKMALETLTGNLNTAIGRLNRPVMPEDGAAYGAATSEQPPMTTATGAAAVAQLKKEGNDAHAGHRYAEAVRWYTAALDKLGGAGKRGKGRGGGALTGSDASVLYCNRAASYLQMGDWATASNDARRAVDADAASWKAHFRLGLCQSTRQPREAVPAFEEAMRLQTDARAREGIAKYLDEARAAIELFKSNEESDIGVGEGTLEVVGWASSPLGKLDSLIGRHGEAAVRERRRACSNSPYRRRVRARAARARAAQPGLPRPRGRCSTRRTEARTCARSATRTRHGTTA